MKRTTPDCKHKCTQYCFIIVSFKNNVVLRRTYKWTSLILDRVFSTHCTGTGAWRVRRTSDSPSFFLHTTSSAHRSSDSRVRPLRGARPDKLMVEYTRQATGGSCSGYYTQSPAGCQRRGTIGPTKPATRVLIHPESICILHLVWCNCRCARVG